MFLNPEKKTMKKKTDHIYHALLTGIFNGTYPPDKRLPPERDMAETYKTSRFAIREAIAMLKQGGFVDIRPQSGTFVKNFQKEGSLEMLIQMIETTGTVDPEMLKALLDFRFVNESEAARRAAREAGKHELQQLKGVLEEKAARPEDIKVQSDCDYRFHAGIISAGGGLIHAIIFRSFKPVYSFFTDYFYSLEGASTLSLKLNRALLKALEEKNPDAASRAMVKILKYGKKRVLEAMNESENDVM